MRLALDRLTRRVEKLAERITANSDRDAEFRDRVRALEDQMDFVLRYGVGPMPVKVKPSSAVAAATVGDAEVR